MPRKHARPAAKKQLTKLMERMAKDEKFKRAPRPFLADPHFGDGFALAVLAASIFRPRNTGE